MLKLIDKIETLEKQIDSGVNSKDALNLLIEILKDIRQSLLNNHNSIRCAKSNIDNIYGIIDIKSPLRGKPEKPMSKRL